MAVREFTSRDGRAWRVWAVTPESLQPLTRAEDYLADFYSDGWIVFETLDGQEKRRLYPPPYAWEERTDSDLELLLARADILRPRDRARVRGDQVLPADLPPSVPKALADAMPRDNDGNLDTRYLGVVRSIESPDGERWTVAVATPASGSSPVLRFASSTGTLDLSDWPAEWIDLTGDELVALLRSAGPSPDRPHSAFRPPEDPGADATAR